MNATRVMWIRHLGRWTFFADVFLCARADIIVEFPSFRVSHPSEVHTVLIVLPVVWLVGLPQKEVLRSTEQQQQLRLQILLLSQTASIVHKETSRKEKYLSKILKYL